MTTPEIRLLYSPQPEDLPADRFNLVITISARTWPQIMVQLIQILARLTAHKITSRHPIPIP